MAIPEKLEDVRAPARPIVAIANAPSYDSARWALRNALNLIGDIGNLVRHARVTVKVNLSGWGQHMLGIPAMESYIVHSAIAHALTEELVTHGAASVRFVESAPTLDCLFLFAARLGWDTTAMMRLGDVSFVNTRNSSGSPYARIPVRDGRLFDWFDVNRAYAETDVFVSLAKMKNHQNAGVTLTMKNLFGMPPNSLYSLDAPSEDAVGIRMGIHDRRESTAPLLPGECSELAHCGPDVRIPNAIVDLCSARPIHLAILDGITSVAGGEGPWNEPHHKLRTVRPNVVIAGLDPVATDAVATAVMGYSNPMQNNAPPFHFSANHIRMAHDAGLGIGDIGAIDVRGMTITDARCPYAWTL